MIEEIPDDDIKVMVHIYLDSGQVIYLKMKRSIAYKAKKDWERMVEMDKQYKVWDWQTGSIITKAIKAIIIHKYKKVESDDWKSDEDED